MSSSRAKSQAEQNRKSRTSGRAATPPTQEIAETNPVTSQWLDTLVQDINEGDDIVGDIVDEVMGKVMDICYQIYLKTQHIPFTTSWTKNHATHNIVRHFICLDVGEDPNELSITEDFEPVPTRIDSWGQGCVPVYADPESKTSSAQDTDVSCSTQRIKPTVKQKSKSLTPVTKSTKQKTPPKAQKSVLPSKGPRPLPTQEKAGHKKMEQAASLPESVQNGVLPSRPPHPPPTHAKAAEKKTMQPTLLTKSVQKSVLPKMAMEVESKAVADPVVKQKTPSFHRAKQETPILKIDPSSLPKYCCLTQYEIVEDEHKKRQSQNYSVRPKRSTKYTKHPTESTSLNRVDRSGDKSQMLQKRNEKPVSLQNTVPSLRRYGQMDGPLSRDTMVLAKGVSFLEEQIEIPGLYRLSSSHPVTRMKPLRSRQTSPAVPIGDIIPGTPVCIPAKHPPTNSSG